MGSLCLLLPCKELETVQIVYGTLGFVWTSANALIGMVRKKTVVPADHGGTIRAVLFTNDLKEMEIV